MATPWQGVEVHSYQAWNQLSLDQKTFYLQGMVEGLKFRDGALGPFKLANDDLGIYISDIDSYYHNKLNHEIPVVLIFDLINCRIAGLCQEECCFRIQSLQQISQINSNK